MIEARSQFNSAGSHSDDLTALKVALEATTRKPARLQSAERGYRDARAARAEARQAYEQASRDFVSNSQSGKSDPVVTRAYRTAEAAYAAADAAARKAQAERDEARAAAQPAFSKSITPAATAGHAVLREKLDAAINAAQILDDAGAAATRSGWAPPKVLSRDAPAVLALLRKARVALG